MDTVMGIVFSAAPWSMEDDRTGQRREGVSLEYVMTDNLNPVVNEDGSMGYKHVKESIGISKLSEIQKVPGIYEFQYGFTVSKGKPQMKLQSVKFVSEVK